MRYYLDISEPHYVSDTPFSESICVIEIGEYNKLKDMCSWFEHYITDKQYEKIRPEKDFELKDILTKVREIK